MKQYVHYDTKYLKTFVWIGKNGNSVFFLFAGDDSQICTSLVHSFIQEIFIQRNLFLSELCYISIQNFLTDKVMTWWII